MENVTQPTPSEIGAEISRFVSAVDSLRMTIDSSMRVVQTAHDRAHEQLATYIEKYADVTSRDHHQFVTIKSHDNCHGYHLRRRELDRLHEAQRVLPQSFLIALVSRYDALVGSLVRALFSQKPDALRSSERTFTFAELTQFTSIADAREFIVDKEVESLLRKSH